MQGINDWKDYGETYLMKTAGMCLLENSKFSHEILHDVDVLQDV